MKKTAVCIAEEVLGRFGINYRKFPCKNGIFFYCKIPSGSDAFDLQWNENGVIRLWRFVSAVPTYMAGKRCEYRKSNDPYAAIGIEITDEGDVSFFAEQKIDLDDFDSQKRIAHMIAGYVFMTAHMKLNMQQAVGASAIDHDEFMKALDAKYDALFEAAEDDQFSSK